jgi:hypothetical protein
VAATTIVWVVTLVALIVVLGFAVGRIMRMIREIKRIAQRIETYAELPVVGALEKAGADAERLALAIEEMEPLIVRARRAVAVIRRGPIPPEVTGGIFQIGAELQTLREFIP